jgi:hypothetical protein
MSVTNGLRTQRGTKKKREGFTTTKGTKRHESRFALRYTLPLKLLFSCFFKEKAIVPKVYGTMHVSIRGYRVG